MNIFRIARYFAWGLLLAPACLLLAWATITYLPGVADFLKAVVWAVVGEIPIFAQAGEILQSMISIREFSLGLFLSQLPLFLISTLSDALIISCCIFLTKAICIRFNRRWQAQFSKPVWFMVLVGGAAGVLVCMLKELPFANAEAIVTLVACLACYLGGIGLMLRGTVFTWGGTYHNRWAGSLIGMLLGIIGNVFDAVCGVFIATTLMQGADFIKNGGRPMFCVSLIVTSALMLFVKNALLELLQPQEV